MNDTETQSHLAIAIALLLSALSLTAVAQESPYFVTYNHDMEEPHDLEIAFSPVLAIPKNGSRSIASNLELEYGVRGWWTSSLYLDGTSSTGTSVFTGYRLENRFRLLMEEHPINPVVYVEFANTTGADRLAKEIVGFDSSTDFEEPLREVASEREREIETKLILSSNRNGWNFAFNAIGEKNLAGGPWEFGYALATSRPLRFEAIPQSCTFCRENFAVGLEVYGGAGEQGHFTLRGTSHYVAPSIAWNLPDRFTLRFSPGWGVTGNSLRSFIRFGISYEVRIR